MCCCCCFYIFFFFKQKTAYEMRISDWSSDVCSSDLYKMLRLSALAPTLIDVIAKDQLSLEAARALTLTEDHDQQIKVCKAANGHAHTIRRMQIGRASCRERVCQYV